MKPLTIITNFEGAHVGVPVTTLSSLEMLKDAIKYEQADTIRLMGGGDPLYEIDKHQKYYGQLFRICRDHNISIELHTSHIGSNFPYRRCKSVTYRIHDFDYLTKIAKQGHEWVRVEFIVGKGCTLDLIDKVTDYCNACRDINDLHFRCDGDKGSHLPKNCHEYLLSGHNRRWVYVTGSTDIPPYFVNGDIYYSASDVFM